MPPKPAPTEFTVSTTEQERLEYALSAAQTHWNFYQRQVKVHYLGHVILTGITLLGTALTPLLALLLQNKFWIALPSGVAGLAAAANSAFRVKDEWRDSYFALSALDVEIDKFRGRAAPEYALDRPLAEVIDRFQARVASLVMNEVRTWQRQESARHTVRGG